MTDKGLALFGALVLLSVLLLGLASYNTPRPVPVVPPGSTAVSPYPETTRTPRTEPRRTPDRRIVPFLPFDRTPDILGIRPFGLTRGGWEGLGWYATAFGVLLISSVAILYLFARRLRMVRNLLSREPGRAWGFFLLGLVGFGLMALLFALVYLNFATSSLLLVIMPAALLVLLMSLTVVELLTGRLVARWMRAYDTSTLTDLLIGTVILFLASSIPYLGWAIMTLAAALGFGTLLYTRFGTSDGWNADILEG